jgi:hypothetical protein
MLLTSSSQLFYAQTEAEKQTASVPKIHSKKDAEQYLDHLSELPNEVQLIIFDYLLSADSLDELNKNIAHYSEISKRFYAIANSNVGIKKICTARISLIRKDINTYISDHFRPEFRINYSFPKPKKTNRRWDTFLIFSVSQYSSDTMMQEQSPQVIPNAYQLAASLIECGANVNEVNTQTLLTPLMAATHDPQLVALLLTNGAQTSVNAKDKQKQTALMFAAIFGNPVVIDMLLQAKATVNAKSVLGYTALMYAIAAGNEDAVEILLKAGAQVLGYKTILKSETARDVAERLVERYPDDSNRRQVLQMLDEQVSKEMKRAQEEWQKHHPMTIM